MTISSTSTSTSVGGVRAFSRNNIKVSNGTIKGVEGASSAYAIFFSGVDNSTIENITALDTNGIEISGGASSFVRNNIVDGDTIIGLSTTTPTIVTRGLRVSARQAIIENNLVQNNVSSLGSLGGINNNLGGLFKNNVVRNISNTNGVCISGGTGSLMVQNMVTRCFSTGSTDLDDIRGTVLVDNSPAN